MSFTHEEVSSIIDLLYLRKWEALLAGSGGLVCRGCLYAGFDREQGGERAERAEELDKVAVGWWNKEVDCESIRGEKLFGWKQTEYEMNEEMYKIVGSNAISLGMVNDM